MYVVFVFPSNKAFYPHIWKEGGEFKTFEAAEFQAEQIRTGMKAEYKKVFVIPKNLKHHMFSYNKKGKLDGWYLIVRRTFEALNYPKDSKERIKLNESNITSEYMTSSKWAILGENFSTSAKTLREATERVKGYLDK